MCLIDQWEVGDLVREQLEYGVVEPRASSQPSFILSNPLAFGASGCYDSTLFPKSIRLPRIMMLKGKWKPIAGTCA
jgi:hypothetical protein